MLLLMVLIPFFILSRKSLDSFFSFIYSVIGASTCLIVSNNFNIFVLLLSNLVCKLLNSSFACVKNALCVSVISEFFIVYSSILSVDVTSILVNKL